MQMHETALASVLLSTRRSYLQHQLMPAALTAGCVECSEADKAVGKHVSHLCLRHALAHEVDAAQGGGGEGRERRGG